MKEQTTNARPVVALEGVSKRFGDVTAVDAVDLSLKAGEVTALLGPNGAGKTTTVKLMMGLARPSEGRVRLFGGDPWDSESRMRIGAMMQISGVPATLKVREHVDLFRAYYPRPLDLEEAMEVAGLTGLENRLYGKLSGGQQQRLMFALAVCGDPELLFLDEPTVGLDVESRRAFWKQIRNGVERGSTVLLTTHYLEEADALADRVVVIDQGRIVADGTPAEIKSRAASKRIRCRTAIDLMVLEGLAGVHGARIDGEVVELLTSHAEPVVRELLTRDPELRDLEVVGADLEAAFLTLTGKTAHAAAPAAAAWQKGAA